MKCHGIYSDCMELRSHLNGFGPGFLFRGQNRRYKTSVPFLARLAEVERGQAYTICRKANILSDQFMCDAAPFPLDMEHLLALLQHYGWPTPYLDLTDSPEVAIFFALHGHSGTEPAVIYIVEKDALPQGVSLVSHHDLIAYPGYKSLNLRWSRQRAWALSAKGWPDMLSVESVDLESLEYAPAVSYLEYHPGDFDDPETGDLMKLGNTSVAVRLQELIDLMCKSIHGAELHHRLRSTVWSICPLD